MENLCLVLGFLKKNPLAVHRWVLTWSFYANQAVLTHGRTIQLVSAASGKTVRITKEGVIDGNGGGGTFGKFTSAVSYWMEESDEPGRKHCG